MPELALASDWEPRTRKRPRPAERIGFRSSSVFSYLKKDRGILYSAGHPAAATLLVSPRSDILTDDVRSSPSVRIRLSGAGVEAMKPRNRNHVLGLIVVSAAIAGSESPARMSRSQGNPPRRSFRRGWPRGSSISPT